jgi:hypothetical protein
VVDLIQALRQQLGLATTFVPVDFDTASLLPLLRGDRLLR